MNRFTICAPNQMLLTYSNQEE